MGDVAAVDRLARGDAAVGEILLELGNGDGAGIRVGHHQERHLLLQRQHVEVAARKDQRHRNGCKCHPPSPPRAATCDVGDRQFVADGLGDCAFDLRGCVFLSEHFLAIRVESDRGSVIKSWRKAHKPTVTRIQVRDGDHGDAPVLPAAGDEPMVAEPVSRTMI